MTANNQTHLLIRKIMLTFLLVIGVLVFLSLQPAAAQIEDEGDLSFQLNYDGTSYTVVGCEKTAAGNLVIPATYKGLPVAGIGASAFWECANLTGITIPEGITVINPNTFYGCTGLKSITLPDSVTVIGRGAFSGCTGLTDITLSKNLVLIEKTAFLACTTLKSITIPEGVTEIGGRAFGECTNLTNVSIPSSVTLLDGAFSDCPNLSYASYDNGKYLGNANDPYIVLMEASSKDITQCNIHKDTRFLYFRAFASCAKLTEITIPDSVKYIGTGAFAECTALTDVTFGKETFTFGSGSFYGCPNLKGIWVPKENPYFTESGGVLFNQDKTTLIQAPATLSGAYTVPDSVEVINHSAFYQCHDLTGITIPKSVTTIGPYAFGDCQKLTSIFVAEDNPNYKTDSAGVLFDKDGSRLIQMPGAYRGAYAVPDSVTMIDQYSFSGCAGLESVSLPNGITHIEHAAFSGCSKLTSISIPGRVTILSGKAFDGCTGLTEITLTNGTRHIVRDAFANCDNLQKVHYKGAQASWDSARIENGNDALKNAEIIFAFTDTTAPTTEPTTAPTTAPTTTPTTAPITQPTTAATAPVANEQDNGSSTGVIIAIIAVAAIGTAVFIIIKKKKA